MQLLASAMEVAVRAIGLGDVRAVPHALHRVHKARAVTEAALEAGSYQPPKNGDQLTRFIELDTAFHTELERIVRSSRQNDVPATAEAVGKALVACHGCHAEFRR